MVPLSLSSRVIPRYSPYISSYILMLVYNCLLHCL